MSEHQAAYGSRLRVPSPSAWGGLRVPAPVLLTLLAMAAAAINPVGYMGGGFDDWHYLNAARCWAASGPCLPIDHWSARWPLIAPVAASIAIIGEGRASLMIVPFLYALGVVFLLRSLAERLFDPKIALAACALLLITPVFTISMTTLNVDTVELFFLLAALLAWLKGVEGRIGAALIAGAMLGLAMQTRETSIVYLGLFGLWFLRLPFQRQRTMIWSLAGFAAVTCLPLVVHAWAAGDPLLRYRLALAHTTIPSDQLAAAVDTSRTALFNPDFIAGWAPVNGIDLHWTLKPIVNLLTHPQIGTSFLAILLLGALHLARPLVSARAWRPAALLVGAAAAAGLLLAYGLAIDPRTRMFLPLLVAFAIAAAVLGVAAWRQGKRMLILVLAGAAVLQSVPVILRTTPIIGAEAAAAIWLAEAREPITIGEATRRHLALVAGARNLPVDDPDLPLRLELGWGGCIHRAGAGRVERSLPLRGGYPRAAAWAQADPDPAAADGDWLCLTRQSRRP